MHKVEIWFDEELDLAGYRYPEEPEAEDILEDLKHFYKTGKANLIFDFTAVLRAKIKAADIDTFSRLADEGMRTRHRDYQS